jgi:Domain of unknown function (DUF4234)
LTTPSAEIVTSEGSAAPVTSQLRTPVASGRQMKLRNPFAVWIGLPIITFGIYTYVWYYKIHREMAEFDRRRPIPIAGPMLVLLFLGWTIIAPLISFHNAGARVRATQKAAGLEPTCSPALSWLLAFAFGANTLYLQFELNKVVDSYQGVPEGSQVALYV